MSEPYKTVLIGLGKIGLSYAGDSRISQYYQYASHLQALRDHPAFDCDAVLDTDPAKFEAVPEDISCKTVDFEYLEKQYGPEVLVIATPPAGRLDVIRKFSRLKAIVIEKPLAHTYAEAAAIVDYCENNGILLQVNYWRRFDEQVLKLKDNLAEKIGVPQVIYLIYGGGLRNNAVHLIDQVRYLFGPVSFAAALGAAGGASLPIKDDVNIPFLLRLENGACIYGHPLDFTHYREVSMDIWGTKGRLEFLQGGLITRYAAVNEHRALTGERELSHDAANVLPTGAGTALYGLYENLYRAMEGQEELLSPGRSALENERLIDEICATSDDREKSGRAVI